MPCARLSELPSPPPGKTGWPWTQESSPVEDSTRVSIVLPSFNQAEYLEGCIRSVLLQGHAHLELRVMDGGSTDGSRAILERYQPWLDHCQSEKDDGQSSAINQGLRDSSGEVLGWLNSDDLYQRNAIGSVLELRRSGPDADVWIGSTEVRDGQDNLVKLRPPVLGELEDYGRWFVDAGFHQCGALFSRQLFETLGGLDETLQCFLDVDFWLRARQRFTFAACDTPVAVARIYPEAKSFRLANRQIAEWVACTWNLGMRDVAEWRVARSLERAADPERVLPSIPTRSLLRHLLARMFHRRS